MANNTNHYCVGIYWKGSEPENQLPRFQKEGIWENGFDDKFLDRVNKVPVGSKIAAKTTYTRKQNGKMISVLEIHGIGTVTQNPQDGRLLKVNWDKNFVPFQLDGRGAYRSTINKVNNETNIELIFSNRRPKGAETPALDFAKEDMADDYPLNQILFGPPGTGKTYNTISKAVAIIDGIKEEALLKRFENREEIKDRFDELKDNGQIVFCTFHQSMAYEDFIEGIKPAMDDEEEAEGLGYTIEDGILKKLSIEAKFAFYEQKTSGQAKQLSKVEYFNTAYNDFITKIEETLDENGSIPLPTKTGLRLNITQITDKLNIKLKHGDSEREYVVSKNRLLKLFNHFRNIEEITNIHDDIRSVIGGANATAYWAVLSSIFKAYEQYLAEDNPIKEESIKHRQNYDAKKIVASTFSITRQKVKETAPEKYVLIIDEINRGNVSQIFGELITLIEEDKRLGMDEALEVTLPYSKKTFGVPPNLYIIGTMNTADRSVEALDTALRRRFSFQEMPPDYKLLPSEQNLQDNQGIETLINLQSLLKTINKRIEKLLDKDHLIGHSYFMGVKNIHDLQLAFKNKIIPLLQEYFFGDFGKIGLILGKGFVASSNETENIFAEFDKDVAGDFNDKIIYKLTDICKPENEQEFINALKNL